MVTNGYVSSTRDVILLCRSKQCLVNQADKAIWQERNTRSDNDFGGARRKFCYKTNDF
jgi:hypothetical protein